MQSSIVSIVLAVAGGLGFIAFNDPVFYVSVVPYLVGIGLVVIVAVTVWSAGVTTLSNRLFRAIPHEHFNTIQQAADALEITGWRFVVAWMVAMAYLLVLLLWAGDRIARDAASSPSTAVTSPAKN